MRVQERKASAREPEELPAAYWNTGAPAGFSRLTRRLTESHPQEQDHADYPDV